MASRLPTIFRPQILSRIGVRAMSGGQFGDGEGKGGGSGGSIRSAGGAMGKMEAAHEEQYFRELQKSQLDSLKHMLEDEVDHHEKEIRRHMESIDHHKKKIKRLGHKDSDSD